MVPTGGERVVERHSDSFVVEHAKHELGVDLVLLGGKTVPLRCLPIVRSDTVAFVVDHADGVLGFPVACLGGRKPFAERSRVIAPIEGGEPAVVVRASRQGCTKQQRNQRKKENDPSHGPELSTLSQPRNPV